MVGHDETTRVEYLFQGLDEIDDFLAILRHRWLLHAEPPPADQLRKTT
jgi:hypothetical protein